MAERDTPRITVDVVIEVEGRGIVLIERGHPPPGWALPGGFVDLGEDLATAARREVMEETGLEVDLVEQLFTYSDPARDPRHHTVSTVFIGRVGPDADPVGADDARRALVVPADEPPGPLAFDHAQILADYRRYREHGVRRSL